MNSHTIQLKTYTIHVQELNEFLESLSEFLQKRPHSSIYILVDNNTSSNCLPLISGVPELQAAKIIQIEAGERNKNLDTCKRIWDELSAFKADRQALMIDLGGGVIGDMGGFCASVYKRGIDFMQIPTSLLAQVDASVGGKLGVDYMGYKNQIGLFRDPEAVFICPYFLKTLPERELRSGYAEMLKHTLIADKDGWKEILGRGSILPSLDDLKEQIHRSVSIKKGIVEQDWKESGLRKVLNFGHSIGHALESYSFEEGREELLHGEAIAAGMICEAWLSVKFHQMGVTHLEAISAYVLAVFGKYIFPEEDHGMIAGLAAQDKKNRAGKLLFTLLEKPGCPLVDVEVNTESIIQSLQYYQSL